MDENLEEMLKKELEQREKERNEKQEKEIKAQAEVNKYKKILLVAVPLFFILVISYYFIYDNIMKENAKKAAITNFTISFVECIAIDEINIASIQDGDVPYVAMGWNVTNTSTVTHFYSYYAEVRRKSDDLVIASGRSVPYEISPNETRQVTAICYRTSEWLNEGHVNILNSDLDDTVYCQITSFYVDGIRTYSE